MITITSSENDLIYIEFEVTSKCFFKCEYCCADSPLRKEKYSDEEKIKIFKQVISYISKLPFNFGIRIMGGEPMLFKYLQDLINELNKTQNIKKIMLFSNCYLNKIPKGNFEITTSAHYQYLNEFQKALENLSSFKNNVIVNIILPKFNEYKDIKKLTELLKHIKEKNFFGHIQLLFNYSDNKSEYKKWENFLSKFNLNEYFNLFCYYNNNLNNFFNAKKIICEPNCFQISADLKLRCDCNHIKQEIDLKQNFDLSMIKKIKTFCTNKNCFYDNCVYYKMKVVK